MIQAIINVNIEFTGELNQLNETVAQLTEQFAIGDREDITRFSVDVQPIIDIQREATFPVSELDREIGPRCERNAPGGYMK